MRSTKSASGSDCNLFDYKTQHYLNNFKYSFILLVYTILGFRIAHIPLNPERFKQTTTLIRPVIWTGKISF